MTTFHQPINVFPNERCCQHCPPERVCAWDCEYGMNWADIIGMALEQRSDVYEMAAMDGLFRLYNGDAATWQTTR